MEKSLEIPIERLREIFNFLMDSLTEQEGDIIHLERDYFWAVPPDDLYNPLKNPRELTLGQLWHSWESIQNLPKQPDDSTSHHLVWLADVIRALGHPQTREELR